MLQFCNNYTAEVWIAILWRTPNCPDGGDWTKEGWFRLGPGQCGVVSGENLHEVNRYWYYFAQAADGAFWAGVPHILVPYEPFRWCVSTSSTDSRDVGLREVDVGKSNDVTVSLFP
jgi:uncharacterized membrane protein